MVLCVGTTVSVVSRPYSPHCLCDGRTSVAASWLAEPRRGPDGGAVRPVKPLAAPGGCGGERGRRAHRPRRPRTAGVAAGLLSDRRLAPREEPRGASCR